MDSQSSNKIGLSEKILNLNKRQSFTLKNVLMEKIDYISNKLN